ncbi:hypothetical protein [Sphingomonas sp. G-3-2-10]|uniref:hypothetical protein n=1 Tax=Sphingomonas sp. G-3-2-10 TaxID=2728838 RepID=UPI00146B1844|nr:hypothetical protein [Sphingomonas sp. G-3-2-10]NML05516.1 hypothetical protein [Sphingomonas sp. G-3-2-10]
MHKFQMGRVSAIVAAAALVIGSVGPATAAISRDPAPAKSSQEDQGTPAAKTKRYCVESDVTGSRMARRTCKTRDQWLKEDGFDPIGQLSAK